VTDRLEDMLLLLYYGLFSVLRDKDQKPKWNPATLEEVTPEHVDWYFSPLPKERELKL
jgi:3-hydroxyisobutyryl-CoA hydrolase